MKVFGGIKKGIIELADMIAINKADGDNIKRAENAANEYRGALQIFTQAFIISDAANGGNATFDGAPVRSLLVYTMYLFTTAFHDLRMGYASAMAYVLFLIIAFLSWLATRLSRNHTDR